MCRIRNVFTGFETWVEESIVARAGDAPGGGHALLSQDWPEGAGEFCRPQNAWDVIQSL